MREKTHCGPAILVITLAPILAAGLGGVQAAPQGGYTYDSWGQPVPAPPAYIPERTVNLAGLGIGRFRDPQDIFVAGDDRIYILDSGNNRLVCLRKDWTVFRVIEGFQREGRSDRFNNPTGLFITEKGDIYVADKGNNRIVVLNSVGEFVNEIKLERNFDEERILKENFIFKPIKVAVNSADRIYVVSEDTYDGIMEFGLDGRFRGFAGAPKVTPSLIDVFWARISTKEQKKRINLFLPTEFNNLDVDSRGFIYATITASGEERREMISRLNAAGDDILARSAKLPPLGDLLYPKRGTGAEIEGASVFIDLAVQGMDVYSVLDRRRGRIFTYDGHGALLHVFGGLGDVQGTFVLPAAIDTIGSRILVLDRGTNLVTVFRPTEYASAIMAAMDAYYRGHYEESIREWRRVIRLNANLDLGYTGIGRALLCLGRHKEAMRYFKLANNRVDYSKAFEKYRREVISDRFGFFMLTALVLLAFLFWLTRPRQEAATTEQWSAKARISAQTRLWEDQADRDLKTNLRRIARSLRYSLYLIFHPFDGFWDLKHEKRGNVPAATVILAAVVATFIFSRQYTGFAFNPRNLQEFNALVEAIGVICPFFLWCAINWALTTLMDGKGSFKDIYVYTAFALTPLILLHIPMTIVSNFLVAQEGAFYHFFIVLGILWAGILVFLGTAVTHDYSLPKTFGATILIALGIVFAIFVGLLFAMVIDQLLRLVVDVYTEIRLRW